MAATRSSARRRTREAPADGLFQSDGLHPTGAGQALVAATYAAADGLGE